MNTLGDIANVLNGYAFKSNTFSKHGVPVVKIKNMASGKIDFKQVDFYPEISGQLEKYKVEEGDILVSMTGSHITQRNSAVGKVARYTLSSPSLLNQRVGKIVPKQDKCDINFLYYLIANDQTQEYWAGKAGGAANQANISPDIIKSLPIKKVQLDIQRQIGEILLRYDRLIENNEKRIKILKEMAQRLYVEWFIEFNFPGHEKVKMVNGLFEGWEEKKIKDIGKVITGKTPSTSKLENFGGAVLFIKTPDLHGNIFILDTEQTLSDLGAQSQSLKLLPEKTVFVSCIGTLGVVGITSKQSQTNQQINAIIANDKDDYIMLYFLIKGLKRQLMGLGSNGATMGNVNKDKFESIKILYPDKKIRKEFFKITSNLFDEILNLEKQIRVLAKTRDLLIPQLVTGRRELNT
jgi:type I restriction enzyme S subunit